MRRWALRRLQKIKILESIRVAKVDSEIKGSRPIPKIRKDGKSSAEIIGGKNNIKITLATGRGYGHALPISQGIFFFTFLFVEVDEREDIRTND